MILSDSVVIADLHKLQNAVRWCRKNISRGGHLDLESGFSKRMDWCYWQKNNGSIQFFFKNKEDTVQFKLVWL